MQYQVVMSGRLREGVDPQEARQRMAEVFGIENDAALDRFFSGQRLVVKTRLDRVRAGRYLAAIRRAGFECEAEPPLESAPPPPAPVSALSLPGVLTPEPAMAATATSRPAAEPAPAWAGLALTPMEKPAPVAEEEAPPPAAPHSPASVSAPARPADPMSPASPDFPRPRKSGFLRSAWFSFAFILLLVIYLAQGWGGGAFAKEKDTYGKKKYFTMTVPAEVVANYNVLPPYRKDPRMSALENALNAKSVDWQEGAAHLFTQAGSPYTLVLKLKAHAISDGDASMLSTVGYASGGTSKLSFVSLARSGARAGETFELINSSVVTRFREDGMRALAFSLGQRHNIGVEQIEVEVWSGKTAFQMHWALYWMLALTALRIAFRFVLRDL